MLVRVCVGGGGGVTYTIYSYTVYFYNYKIII